MKAILWDGQKQIKGELILEKKRIKFSMMDFSDTDLDFDLAYREIKGISYHKLYEQSSYGLEILSDMSRKNIFIVDDPIELKKAIEVRCEIIQELE